MTESPSLRGRRRLTVAFRLWWLMSGAARMASVGRRLWSWFWRFLILCLLWWVLTDADPHALRWGLPIAMLASLVPIGLPRAGAWRWRPLGLLRFVPTFAWYNFQGGVEVALHALWPGRHPDPLLLNYRMRLPVGPSQIFFANLLNLVPGTLTMRTGRRELYLHILVDSPKVEQILARLEWRVADLFGVDLVIND